MRLLLFAGFNVSVQYGGRHFGTEGEMVALARMLNAQCRADNEEAV